MSLPRGKVITVRGPVEPAALGRVLMHEHLHADVYDWEKQELITEEKPITPERRELLMREAVPSLRKCNDYGCHAWVEVSTPPGRAWPAFYVEASEAASMHVILATGVYREMEDGAYWVHRPEDKLWPFAVTASVDELAEFFALEILEGVHGTDVHAGTIKLATSAAKMTPNEEKCFRAGARAQKATGVSITTHCTAIGAETSQLEVLDDEGVDLGRVVIGHAAPHLKDPTSRRVCKAWMKRGVTFLPTNLNLKGGLEPFRKLLGAIHDVFDSGLGRHIVFGLDWAFVSESGPFGPCSFMPPPPFLYMFTDVLPAMRELGLTSEEEEQIMLTNPQRILPVQ